MKKIYLTFLGLLALLYCNYNGNAQVGVTKYGTNALAANGAAGEYNTGLGFFVLAANNSGNRNTGVGANTLRFTTLGIYNTGVGAAALYQNVNGSYNSAYGAYSMFTNTSGYRNTAFGNESMRLNTTGYLNTAFGDRALYSTTSANFNTGLGATALFTNTTGYQNTATGNECLYYNLNGFSNTASGYRSMYRNSDGAYNTANGYNSLFANEGGYSNTAIGASALVDNTSGSYNTAVGHYALMNTTGGSFNVAIGYAAGDLNATGTRNTFLGYVTDGNGSALSNATAIGYAAIVAGSNRVRVGNASVISIGGQVGWTTFSDGRYKTEIKENVQGLAFINSLRPVTYKVNINGINQFNEKTTNSGAKPGLNGPDRQQPGSEILYSGFIAQEVEEAAKKLNYEFSGVDKPENKDGLYGLRYDNFVSPIVKAVQELSTKNDQKDSVINQLQNQIGNLQSQIEELKLIVLKSGTGAPLVNPSAFVKQNAPNPFNENTVISYYVPDAAGSAQIRITDVSGRVIKIFNAAKGEGMINIRKGELAAGNYHYTLIVDNKTVDTKKMIMIK